MADIFKRLFSKKEVRVKNISSGILFEDNGEFLEWGKPLDVLVKTSQAKKEYRADRVIYNWGLRKIFNGLELPFHTMVWNNDLKNSNRRFFQLEFNAVGDAESEKYLKFISEHLVKEFGPAVIKGEIPDILYEWKRGGVIIFLYLYEQHVNKLSFKIAME